MYAFVIQNYYCYLLFKTIIVICYYAFVIIIIIIILLYWYSEYRNCDLPVIRDVI